MSAERADLDRLWRRFFARQPLTKEEERRLRLSGTRVVPSGRGTRSFSTGPGLTMEEAAALPCYLCGTRVRKDADLKTIRLHLVSAADVLPEGTYRLCKRHKDMNWGFDRIRRVHHKRHSASLVAPVWESLSYYHPSGSRERL